MTSSGQIRAAHEICGLADFDAPDDEDNPAAAESV